MRSSGIDFLDMFGPRRVLPRPGAGVIPQAEDQTGRTRLRHQKGIQSFRRRTRRAKVFYQDFPLRKRAYLLLAKTCPSSATERFS